MEYIEESWADKLPILLNSFNFKSLLLKLSGCNKLKANGLAQHLDSLDYVSLY